MVVVLHEWVRGLGSILLLRERIRLLERSITRWFGLEAEGILLLISLERVGLKLVGGWLLDLFERLHERGSCLLSERILFHYLVLRLKL